MYFNLSRSKKHLYVILIGAFSLIFSYKTNALNYARYDFKYDPESLPGCVQIILQTSTDDEGNAVVQIPKNVNSFIVQNMESKSQVIDPINKLVAIQQKPNENVHIYYKSCFVNPSRTLKKALYEKDLLFIDHGEMLILPLSTNIEEKWRYVIDYTHLPKDFNIVANYSMNNRIISIVDLFYNFRETATLAGRFEPKTIHLEQTKGTPVNYIEIGNWDWLQKKPSLSLTALLEHQRKFWQDNDFPNYTIALSSGVKTPTSNGFQGRHFKNFITLSITPNTDHLHTSIIGMSHELFHGWIGNKAVFKNHSKSLAWFTEGFTDYYSARFALESGMISFPEYIQYINGNLIRYYTSPIKKIPREQASQYYRADSHFYQFELTKGSLIAQKMSLLTDNNNDKLIDRFLKKVYVNIQENTLADDKEQKRIVSQHGEAVLGKKLWKKYDHLITSNNLLTLTEKDFGESLKMRKRKVMVPDYNFDVTHFMISKIIRDLHADSPEYAAGLRNGMHVINHNLLFHRPFVDPAIIVVVDNKKVEQTISFYPNLKKALIPQLKILDKVVN